MFTVVEKVDNLRVSSSRHKVMVHIDEMIEGQKVFTLSQTNEMKSRTKNITCDIYDERGQHVVSFSSSMVSFGDAIRQIYRQIKHYIQINSVA